MKPAARRRVERELRDIMREDGDHCSICRSPFQHNTRTIGGTTRTGGSALVGECCAKQVVHPVLGGLFLDNQIDDLVSRLPTTGGGSHSADAAEQGIATVQGIFAERQAEGAAIVRRAGLSPGPAKVVRQSTAWKEDDARWFEQRPTRSHRLRPMIGDEAVATGFQVETLMPPRHEMQVLVRQVEPGKRMRLAFGRNLDVPIPDEETVIHALFDIVSGEGGRGEVISADMMRRAIERYEKPVSNRPT